MKFSEVDLELISRNELYIQKICKILISTVICDASFKKLSNIGHAQRWVLTPTPSLLEIAYAVAVVRCGTFLVLTRSLFFIFLELNLTLQVV